MNTSLDNFAAFNAALYAAVELGTRHAAERHKRLPSAKALHAIASNAKLGTLNMRRFQAEILTRAYGLPFINRDKLAYAASLEAATVMPAAEADEKVSA